MGSTAENITRAFNGDWHGTWGAIPTPGHSARDGGTTVKDADDGGVLFNSFNGGDWKSLKEECERRGLLPNRANDNCAAWRVAGTYEYSDETGNVLYRTVRKEKLGEKKKFAAERREGNGWQFGLGEVRRVPYRLPQLLAADPAEPVLFVEGERKANKLAAMGFTATAIAFGCKGWRLEYASHFAGRTIIIQPDNDDEGRGFAAKVKQSLQGTATRAEILELPDLPPKGDIINWKGSTEDLRALTEALLNPPAQLLPLIDIAAWQHTVAPEREWVLEHWIPFRQFTYLTGPGSAGKSLLAQQLCTATAIGLPFLGTETRQSVAMYVTCEDDPDELHRRQKAICEALKVPLHTLPGKLHLVSLAGRISNELATFDNNGRMAVGEAYRILRDTALKVGATFICLDNVAHLFAGNENIRNQVAAFCGLLNQLAHEINGSVLLIGHPNKAGDAFSGSTAWENQVRSRLYMETPKNSDGAVEDPDARVLSRGKANYARNGEAIRFMWHKWAFVREDDLPADLMQEHFANVQANSDNETFLTCLRERNKQDRPVSESPASRTYGPLIFAGMPESKKIGRARLEAAMDRLFRIGAIERGYVGRINRKDKFGLREKCADPCADPAPPGCADVRSAETPTCADTHPPLKGGMARPVGPPRLPLQPIARWSFERPSNPHPQTL